MEDVGAFEGKIFFSKEDGAFTFPKEVSNNLGYENVTIVPDDYLTHVSKEYPNGYVIVQCEVK